MAPIPTPIGYPIDCGLTLICAVYGARLGAGTEGECIPLCTVYRCRAVYCRLTVDRCRPLYTAVEL